MILIFYKRHEAEENDLVKNIFSEQNRCAIIGLISVKVGLKKSHLGIIVFMSISKTSDMPLRLTFHSEFC